MRHTTFFAAVAAIMIASGCSNLQTSVQSSSISYTNQAAVTPELSIGGRITGSCSISTVLGIFSFGDTDKQASGVTFDSPMATPSRLPPLFGGSTVEQCAKSAAYNAVVFNGADVIFAPRYTSETWGIPYLFEVTDVKLTGFKGTINGFKQIERPFNWRLNLEP